MPINRVFEWISAGRLAYSREAKEVLGRLLDAGCVQFQDQHLSLAINRPIAPQFRSDFLWLIGKAFVEISDSRKADDPNDAATSERHLVKTVMDNRSLGDIYRQIPSPLPIEAIQPDEVMTEMFPYQLHSLNRMLQREMEPELVHNDKYIPLSTSDDQELRLDLSSWQLTLAPRFNHGLLPDSKGGILSEEMGVGKTLECLALILSTRGSLPSADEEEMAGTVTTSLAMQWPQKDGHSQDPLPKDALTLAQIPYYPTTSDVLFQHDTLGRQLPYSRDIYSVPTLKQMCAHVMRLSGQTIAAEQYHDEEIQIRVRAMVSLLKSATPFYHLWPPIRGNRTPRIEVKRTPVRIYLSAATLIVVPGTLLAQWQGEIHKHILPNAVRVLYLPNAQSKLPTAFELANDYDIILLSHARLGREDNEGALEWKWPSVPRACRCPYIGASRLVDCKCPATPDYQPSESMSSLLQCKFKRICVDEGHVASGDSDMVRMATKIKAECRWIISGTPTESLVGSELYRRSSDGHQGVSRTERKDLEKLRALLGDFLRIPHLQEWHHDYEVPFIKGSLYASTRLWSLLSRVMVRNQPQDIERHSPLPPLHDAIVRLNFTRLERQTFNVLQSLILLNAIWSQREDDDYFFHQSNRKHLANIMENLSLSCFHFVSRDLKEQAKEALAHANRQLAKEDQWNCNDREKAKMATFHLEKALSDGEWSNQSTDVVYQPSELRLDITKSWSRYGVGPIALLTADEIIAMQRAMRLILTEEEQSMDDSEDIDLERVEELITKGEKDKRAFYQREAKAIVRVEKKQAQSTASTSSASMLARTPVSPPKVSSRSGAGSLKRKNSKKTLLEYIRSEYMERQQLPSESILHRAHLNSVSSSKLAKLLELVAAIRSNQKVIIFSNLDNALYEVSTALDIASQPHFIYTSGTNQEQRNEIIDAFRSDQEDVCILLMKSNIGGRGLDLSCANHSIFLEPILDKSLRIQAIKRTWRTGQTRPVYTTTLIIKGTFEEDILRISENASTSKLAEDPNMRAVVSNPTFVSQGTESIAGQLSPPINLFHAGWHAAKEDDHTSTSSLSTPPITPDKSWSSQSSNTTQMTEEMNLIDNNSTRLKRTIEEGEKQLIRKRERVGFA